MKSLARILNLILIAAVIAVPTTIAMKTSAIASPMDELVTNGSFEVGVDDAPSGSWTTQEVGSTNLTGWTITQNNIDWGNGFWQAADGTHSLDLNGNLGAGGISQTISTHIGQTYKLAFALSGNPNLFHDYGIPGDLVVSLTVSAGSTAADFDFDVLSTQTNSEMAWANRFLVFTADEGTTLISFVSTTYLPVFDINLPDGHHSNYPNCCFGPALDNVSVTGADIPEPPTFALITTGILSIFGFGLRRADKGPSHDSAIR